MTITTKADIKELMALDEVAKVLNVSVRTLRRWVKDGFRGRKLVATRLGGKLFFAPSDIESFRSK